MRTITIIIFFLLLGAFFIISEKNLSITKTSDLEILKSNYFSWTEKLINNAAGIVGNTVRMEWCHFTWRAVQQVPTTTMPAM